MPRPESINNVVKLNLENSNFTGCNEEQLLDLWHITDAFIFTTGLLANIALLWVFLRERKTLSASQVLGVNLLVMNLFYLSVMPFNLSNQKDAQVNKNNTGGSATDSNSSNTADPLEETRVILSMFNLIGCPLLMACMCIERYLAVIRPVLYIRLRKWEYRMAVSAVVWVVTLIFCVAASAVRDTPLMMVPISILISCLFLIMITCLGCILSSLLQQSPAHLTHLNQARSESPLKRKAVKNVLFIVVPAVISYFPILLMVPLILYMNYWNDSEQTLCDVIELCFLFPSFGVYIGPLFYLSKAKQMCCLKGKGKTSNT